jgi:hypothetical protein
MRFRDTRMATTSGSLCRAVGAGQNSLRTFKRQLLAIVTAETFSVEESQPHAIRVCLGATSSRSELVRALEILAAALKSSAARTRVV